MKRCAREKRFVKRFASDPIDVGCGYTVEFELRRGEMICLWSPGVPTGADLSAVMDRYTTARDLFIWARINRFVGTMRVQGHG